MTSIWLLVEDERRQEEHPSNDALHDTLNEEENVLVATHSDMIDENCRRGYSGVYGADLLFVLDAGLSLFYLWFIVELIYF